MTNEDITAARALIAAATEGPWTADVWIETDGNGWRATGPHHEDEAHDHGSEPGCPDEQSAQRDAAFIALARSALPAALDEIERLRVMVKEAHRIDLSPEGRATYDNLRDRYFGEHRAEIEQLRGALSEFAEYDCEYDDGCPTFGTRHGRCIGCKARQMLDAAKGTP